MRKSIDRLLIISTTALLLSSFLALASAPTVGAGIFAVAFLQLAVWPLGEYLERRLPWYHYATNGIAALFAATLPLWVSQLGLLPAVIALIMYIQAHKLAHRKERKDFYQLFLMCFLLLIAACGLGPDATVGIAMLCFLISSVWAIMGLQIRTEVNQVGPSGLADILPLSEREPEPTSPSPSLMDWGMLRAVGMVCIAAALLTAALFFGTPRMEAGILGRSNILTPAETRRSTGLSDTVEVGQGGRIEVDHSPIMRVEFPDAPEGRYSGELYWPSSTMDTFSAGVWDRLGGPYAIRDSRPRPVPVDTGDRAAVAREPGGQGRLVRQVIYLDQVPRTGLPCLASPVRLSSQGATVSWNPLEDGFFVQVDRLKSPSISYEVVSEVITPPPRQLRNARADYASSMSRQDYFLLTRHTLQDETVRLVQELTEEHDTLYDKARALEAWLGSDVFAYTLDEPALPRHSPIDAFLFEARRGHCELYASALALMLRTLGIPTRVVSGYRGGEWNPADRSYTVSRDMAHLWVEVYFLDYGWVTFDPSPRAQEDVLSALERAQLMLSRSQWRLRIFWYRRIIGYEGGFTLERLKGAGQGLIAWTISPFTNRLNGTSPGPRRDGILSRLALPGLLASLALFAVYLRFRGRSRKTPQKLTEAQRRAIVLLDRVRRVLKRRGIDCERRTAGELLAAARSAELAEAEEVAEAIRMYNEARFGNRPLERSQLKQALRLIRPSRVAR